MLRIVLDTNVLIEGAKDAHSYPVRIMRLVLAKKLQPLVSLKTKKEHQKIIDRLIASKDYLKMIEDFFKQTEYIEVASQLRGVTNDREDDKFVELAVDGDADYIITDDNHLLKLGHYQNIDIVSPQKFWNTYREIDQEGVKALGY